MVAIVSGGELQAIAKPSDPRPARLSLADGVTQDYAEIWRTQPAVRTVVQFLARNIAQLGLPMYRRLSDIDRERVPDHPLLTLLSRPMPRVTGYAFKNAMVHDLGIYDISLHKKLRRGREVIGLLRIPPAWATPKGGTWWQCEEWEIRGSSGSTRIAADDMLTIHGYNPEDSRIGASPIEALRRILSEEYEAGRMREQSLRNGARIAGYLKRPKDAPKWTDDSRERFKAGWRAQYAGGGPEAGGTPVLEDGMDFVQAAQTAEQLQYIDSRKLTREEVASAYFIPPPLVGILDHATFSNIQEQHKQLYQDTLGPWLEWLQAELELQLLAEFSDSEGLYLEFNMAEKLKGTPEEQAATLSTAIGAPVMTRAEGRARMNLRHIEGTDELIVPLNVGAPKGAQAADDTEGEPNAD